jgi:GT2 family glycosyltransferase
VVDVEHPLVSIVILNWNGGLDTLRCIESLARISYSNWEAIVVDNGSSDQSLSLLRGRDWPFTLDILETGRNLGFAEGNNAGVRLAIAHGARYVMLLNNDTIVSPDLIDALVGAAESHPQDGIFGPVICYLDRPDVVWFACGKWNAGSLQFEWPGQGEEMASAVDRCAGTDYVCGAGMFFRAEIVERIGLLDGRFFLVYEESDWCFRARRAGIGCRMVPAARIWHKIGASFGTEASPLRSYFSTRNELLWAEKNLPLGSRGRILARAIRRHLPAPSLGTHPSVPLAKRIAWAAAQFGRDWRRLMGDARQRASRRGLRDYLLRRFGDCPPEVRQISGAWAADASAGGSGPATRRSES